MEIEGNYGFWRWTNYDHVVNIKKLHQCDKKKLEKILSIYTVSVRWHPLKIYRLYIHRWNVLNLMVTTGNIYILSNTAANLKAHTWPKVNLMITNGMDSRLGRDMNLEKKGGGDYTHFQKKRLEVLIFYISMLHSFSVKRVRLKKICCKK